MPVVVESYKPHEKQFDFHADPANVRLLLGGYGGGKTCGIVWEAINTALQYPGCLIGVFRKTGPALRDTTMPQFLEELPKELIVSETKSEGREQVVLPGNSRIWFRPLDDWRKLGSTAFDLEIVDEAWELTLLDFNTLLGRLRGKVGPWRMVLATNPPNIDHWLYKTFVESPREGFTVHHFSAYDNRAHLRPGYIEELEARPPNERRKFLHGEWGFLSEGAPVYGECTLEHHVANLRYVPGVPLLMGMDFGFRHPAAVWGQVLPLGHANVLRAIMGDNVELAPFLERVKSTHALNYPDVPIDKIELHCDVAGKQNHGLGTAIKVVRNAGFHPRYRFLPLAKSIESIRYLLRTWHLNRPLLQVDRQNARIVWEGMTGGYAMDADTDEPEKDGFYEHPLDGTRYMLAPAAMPLAGVRANRPLPPRPRVAV